MMIEIILGFL